MIGSVVKNVLMVRVLLLFEYPTLNGGERSLLATLPAMQRAGIDYLAVAPPDGPLATALRLYDVTILPWSATDARGQRLPGDDLREQLAQFIRQADPALLHANSVSMARMSGPVVSQLRLPSIGHLRDMINVSAASVSNLVRHTRLLAVSRATSDWYARRGIDSDRLSVLYNGVDPVQFAPTPDSGYLRRQLQLGGDSQLVAAIGQIGMRKGLDVLLEAAKIVIARQPQVHMLLVGSRLSQKDEAVQFASDLRLAASKPPLTGHVHFLGQRDDISTLLNELTLLVHPARQEPLGRVLLEAAACALPVVATRVGGTEEIFAPSEPPSALLVPADRPPQLANAILDLLGNPNARRELGQAARRRMIDVFHVDRAAAGLVRHYREVAG